MNTGQMLLVIAAAVVFATTGLSIGDLVYESDRVSVESKIGMMAVSAARERLADRLAAPFDSLIVGTTIDTLDTTLATFACSTHIGFVSDSVPNTVIGGPTAVKRVHVSVTSAYLHGPIALTAIAGNF